MYPRHKKTTMDWMLSVFVGLSILFLLGAIAFGVFLTRGNGKLNGKGEGSSRNNILQVR